MTREPASVTSAGIVALITTGWMQGTPDESPPGQHTSRTDDRTPCRDPASGRGVAEVTVSVSGGGRPARAGAFHYYGGVPVKARRGARRVTGEAGSVASYALGDGLAD